MPIYGLEGGSTKSDGGNRVTFMTYGQPWRTVRRILHRVVLGLIRVNMKFLLSNHMCQFNYMK